MILLELTLCTFLRQVIDLHPLFLTQINRADLRLLKWMKEDVCNSVTHNVTVTRKNLMIREPVPSRSPQLARKGSQLGLICRHNYGVLPRENEKEALLYHVGLPSKGRN
ncbi:hypothetical protein Aperf_G00000054133 [Anoplocephala perfoliata]